MRSTKISIEMFAFLLHLLIENFKPESYCFERNKGFDVGMATILSYIKPRSTSRITIIGYSIPPHFSWFTNLPEELKLLLLN